MTGQMCVMVQTTAFDVQECIGDKKKAQRILRVKAGLSKNKHHFTSAQLKHLGCVVCVQLCHLR